jgi:hypothetical protein
MKNLWLNKQIYGSISRFMAQYGDTMAQFGDTMAQYGDTLAQY